VGLVLVGEQGQFRTSGALTANDGQFLLRAEISGLGIACLPSFLFSDALREGQVVNVISHFPRESQGIYLVYPKGRFTPPKKVCAFIDFLATAFVGKGPEK
jgi:DNA-binding transcriptional LysR family regulator